MPARPMDPRTRRSRSALETALRELIAERDLSQISVSDITKRAGVNRSTFYEHYTDVHDLAAAACTDGLRRVGGGRPRGGPAGHPDGGPPDNPLPDLFAHVAEHAPLYRALLGDDGSARVINHLLQRMTVSAHIGRGEPGPADTRPAASPPTPARPRATRPRTARRGRTPHDPAAAFVAGAVLGSVVDWLRHGCPGTPEEMGAALWPLLIGIAAAAGWETEPPGPPVSRLVRAEARIPRDEGDPVPRYYPAPPFRISGAAGGRDSLPSVRHGSRRPSSPSRRTLLGVIPWPPSSTGSAGSRSGDDGSS